MCLKDTCTLEEQKLKDPRRLYAPGRLYHIIERKPCRVGRLPPVVRTAVPVDGRFEHIIVSCNATSDHAVIWIERESQKALDNMLEKDRIFQIPAQQKMERQLSIAREHGDEYNAAMQKATALGISQANSPPSYGTFLGSEEGETSASSSAKAPSPLFRKWKASWDNFVDRLFEIDESGQIVFKKLGSKKDSVSSSRNVNDFNSP